MLAAALLSSSYTLTKVALRDVPPLSIGFLRFVVAAVLLGVWVKLRRYPTPPRGDRRTLVVGGLLGITAYFSIENFGVQLATPTDAALLVAGYPALTVLLELAVYRSRPRVGTILGIALAIIGVFLIVGYIPGVGIDRRIGDLLLIVSGIVWALYNFATRNVSCRYPIAVVIYHQTRVGAVGFAVLAVLFEHGQWHAPRSPLATALSLASLTVLCSIAGLVLYAKGLTKLKASTAVNVLNLVPLFGLLIPIVFLGDAVTWLQVLGGVVVVIGVTFTSRSDRARQPRPSASSNQIERNSE